MKIKHEGYIELNDRLLEEYYQQEHKLYKGYRVLGIDGSKIELPHGSEIQSTFGSINHNERMINVSWSTVVYDLLNNQVIDSKLNKYGSSEREYAIEQFKNIKQNNKQRKDIIVADRGFPSLELFVELKRMGYDFVIRYNGEQFLRETSVLLNSQENDKIIEISLRKGSKREENPKIKELLSQGVADKITLRIVKVGLKTGVDEYLITSLLSQEEFGSDDFMQLYKLRWNQEVYFDFQKNVLQVENFSGKTVESILQDYYSRVLVGNIHSMILSDAQKQIDEELINNSNLKYKEYKSNRSVTYGLMRNRIYKMLTDENLNWEKEYDDLLALAIKYKVPVIKDRNFERKKKGNLKYSTSKRRAF